MNGFPSTFAAGDASLQNGSDPGGSGSLAGETGFRLNARQMAASMTETQDDAAPRPVEIAGGGGFPICLEGIPYVGFGLLVGGLVGVLVHPWGALPFLAFALFSAWFFRNPTRNVPTVPGAVLAPADGVVCQVTEVEETEHLGQRTVRLSIFMSLLNVHVNRAPVAGRVVATKHVPGRFRIASADKASEENERNSILLETAGGRRLLFVQIAGSIARRILCYARPGDRLAAGQRFGLIRFGSRVDVYFPRGSTLTKKVGDRVVGGETVLGTLPTTGDPGFGEAPR